MYSQSKSRVYLVSSLINSSGSLFVYSLLDGHPDLMVFPFTIEHLLRIIPVKDNQVQVEDFLIQISADKMIFDTAFSGSASGWNVGLNALGSNKNQCLRIDREIFLNDLKNCLGGKKPDLRTVILETVRAYHEALHRDGPAKHYLIYTHDLHWSLLLKKIIPDAVMIGVCRHPVNLFQSHSQRGARKTLAMLSTRLKPSSYRWVLDGLMNIEKARKDIIVVLLEQLHYDPESSMRVLIQRLGISYNPCLMESTLGRLAWWGSSVTNVTGINGFSKTLHQRVYTREMGDSAVQILWRLTHDLQQAAGYKSGKVSDRFSLAMLYLKDSMYLKYCAVIFKSIWITLRSEHRFKSKVVRVRSLLSMLFLSPWSRFADYRYVSSHLKDRDFGSLSELDIINPMSAEAMHV